MLSSRKKAAAASLFLSDLHTGSHGRIAAIRGGWSLRQRLNQVGIHPGDSIRVVRGGQLGGPVLIHIHSTDVALGNRMAAAILVDLDEA
ncbi:MAG TPA: FeoA family protein [bacterium]|nr:FeoA family protein [bacterium]HQJ64735.1 FeoA family protein [bacterium]